METTQLGCERSRLVDTAKRFMMKHPANSILRFCAPCSVFLFGMILAACSGNLFGDDSGSSTGPPLPAQPVPAEVETQLSKSTVRVGQRLSVDCNIMDEHGKRLILDREGNFIRAADANSRSRSTNPSSGGQDSTEESPGQLDPKIRYSPRTNFVEKDTGVLEPVVTGNGAVSCAFPSVGLIDSEPARLTIKPGRPHLSVATIEPTSTKAGNPFRVGCLVFDERGNRLDGLDPDIGLSATGGAISINQTVDEIIIESMGVYEVSCAGQQVEETVTDMIEVVPNRPSELSMSLVPSNNEYQLDQVVQVVTSVTDDFGNPIRNAELNFSISPSNGVEAFGRGRYQFTVEDRYTIEVTVPRSGEPLTARKQIKVNQFGPGISCDYPAEGAAIEASDGSSVQFRGSLSDQSDPTEVEINVNGSRVDVLENGNFSAQVSADYGLNFVDITATDQFGETSHTTCSFLAADRWRSPSDYLDGVASLRLDQKTLDDNSPNDNQLNSLADIIHTILNSDGFKEQVNSQLKAANPLNGDPKILYKDGEYKLSQGTHVTDMTFTDTGLELSIRIEKPEFRFKVDLPLLGFEHGWLKIETIEVVAESKLGLTQGEPSLQIQEIRRSQLDGVDVVMDRTLVDWGATAFGADGKARDAIKGAIEDLNTEQINGRLDSIISSLGVDGLDFQIPLPRLDSDETLNMSFGFRPSSIETNSNRGLFGVGTRFNGPTNRASGLDGIPLPDGDILKSPNTSKRLSAGVHIGLVNQALYSIWKAGYFDINALGEGSLSEDGTISSGTTARLDMTLPPVATLSSGGGIDIGIGGVQAVLNHSSVGGGGLTVKAGGVIETNLELTGDSTSSIEFTVDKLSNLYLTPSEKIEQSARDKLKRLLKNLFERLSEESLNSALPALPIPTFRLPGTLNTYGLPGGQPLGVKSPSLQVENNHLVIDSQFGVQ